MKRLVKKILSYEIPEKWLAVLFLCLLCVALLPIFRLAYYAFPWYDDYIYSVHVKPYLQEYGSWQGALLGAFYVVRNKWHVWQGTYSSIFMMALMPEIFGKGLYCIGLIFSISFFAAAGITLVKVLSRNLLKMKWHKQISTAVLVILMMIELIYTAQQGIFWYNSAVHYTFMHGMMFFMIASAVKLVVSVSKKQAVFWALITAVLAFICAGANFVTCLQGILFLFVVMAAGCFFRKKRSLWLMPALAVYGMGMFINVTAPGNDVRGAFYQGYGPVQSILSSFQAGFRYFWEYTGSITIIILAVFVLLIWNSVRDLEFTFPMPGIVTFVSFGLYCTGFTPAYYAMGGESLSRTMVVIKFTLQILLLINVTYWLGWCMKKWRKRDGQIPRVKQWWVVYAACGFAAVLWLVMNPNQAGSCSSYGAYYYVSTGEAYNIYSEYEDRIEIIENSNEDMVEVKPYFWKPWFLFRGDLTTDIKAETNASMAEWYGKNGIYIKE